MEGRVEIYSFFKTNLSKNRHFRFPKYLKKFGALKTNVERVNFAYKDLLEHCPDFPAFKKDEKDDATAVKKRESGNVFFKLGKYREALDCYTASALAAKSGGVLAFAYANRSAALSKLGLHKECLIEIDRALQHGYPDALKPKLIKRRKHSRAQKTTNERYYEPVPTFPDSERNPLIKSARNCVEITKIPQYGRCVMATRDIEIGEILAVEKPYVALVKDEIYVHCHECFELCYNLIPCNSCTKALYCGESCKERAFATYHKYECPLLLSLDSIFIDPPKRLALKSVFMAKDEFGDCAAEEDEVYRSDRFREVYHMEGHAKERSHENFLARAVTAAALFHLIKNHTTFLQDGVSEDRLKDVLLVAILVCGINTVDLNELSPTGMTYDISPLALGVYSFFTLINHSCWPNVFRHFHGSTMVMRAYNTIKKGEQCFVIYGPNYLEYPKEFRQNFLANHQFFTCTCKACEEDWPVRTAMHMMKDWMFDGFFTMMKLSSANVDAAKQELQQLLIKAKQMEMTVPPGRDFAVKDLLNFCYNIFGNKRRI